MMHNKVARIYYLWQKIAFHPEKYTVGQRSRKLADCVMCKMSNVIYVNVKGHLNKFCGKTFSKNQYSSRCLGFKINKYCEHIKTKILQNDELSLPDGVAF